MHITCPACAATYEIPETLLRPGRRVRCAQCGEEWIPLGEAPEAMPDQTAIAAPPQPAEKPHSSLDPPRPAASERSLRAPADSQPERRPRTHPILWLGWAASVAIVVFALWGGMHYRASVIAAWPPSERLYAALGLASVPR